MIAHQQFNGQSQSQIFNGSRNRTSPNVIIAFVNNKEEAMMFNVPKGYTAYLFEFARPVFYVKDCDGVSGQIAFSEYTYEEVIQPQAPDPSTFVTRNDMVDFKNDIMQSIAELMNNRPNNPSVVNNQGMGGKK